MAYRLLVVPGDSDELRTLPGQFSGDVEVQVLDTANDALWEVRNTPPGVIIANVQLPGMSGVEMAEILPNFGVPTRLVLWSRHPDPQAAQQAASFGVQRFVNGTVPPDELRDLLYAELREALNMPEPAPEPEAPPPEPAPRPKPEPASRPARTPAQPPARTAERPAEPAAPRPARRREGALVLTAEDQRAIRLRMEALDRDVGSKCILLADRAGMVLAETGLTVGLPTMVLLPLLSTSFSTAGQITQMLRETESSALYVHEGSHYDLYCFDIVQRFMLVIVFDKSGTPAKIGSVWVYAKRAIRDIQELLG